MSWPTHEAATHTTIAGRATRVRGVAQVPPSVVLAIILVAACALRLYKFTAFAFWFDESVSLALSRYPWSHVFARIGEDIGPPLYFVVLKLWCLLFGQSLAALRSLSLACDLAAVWLAYLFVKEAFGSVRLALVAALLLAVNPFQIQYARETRMYAMGVCLVLLASWCLARALRSGRPRDWIVYAAAAAACVYTHYYLIFSIVAQAIVAAGVCLAQPVPRQRARALASCALAYALAAVLFVPWLPTFLAQTRRVQQDFWIPRLTTETVLRIPWALVFGGSDSGWAPIPWLVVVAAGLVALLAVAARHARSWPSWLVIAQAVVPIVAGLALSTNRPIFVDRYFLFASAFWSILLALVIARAPAARVRHALVACVVLMSVAAFAKNLNAIGLASIRHPTEKPGMAGAAAFVNSHARPGDAIVVAHSLIFFSLTYYNTTPIRPLLYSTVRLEAFPYYAGRSVLDPEDMLHDLLAIAGPRRVWYVWTDGFYQHKLDVPASWRLESTRRFEDTPTYKGSIVIDTYWIP
jgi:uncharacterized membrane protein